MRRVINIDKDWKFSKAASSVPTTLPSDWESIDLPYTFNGDDGQDGGNDYYRGKGYFAKNLAKSDMPDGEEVYLQLDGVNSTGTVYFNGREICVHDGGYSTFRVKLDDIKDENLLVVVADNSPNDYVYPQVADFTFYGGIYRDVSLIGVGKNHFDLDFYGAPGIAVTPEISGDDAKITVDAYCVGEVEFEISDGNEVVARAKASGKNPSAKLEIKDVHLWNGVDDPFLYTAVAKLIVDGEAVDEVKTRFGCRTCEIDAQKGFILNGREYPLRGVSRHQDRPHIGNALLPEHHKEDMDLICEMGANTIRLAHYQHAQYFYDLCDERGIVVWAEIPYISKHLEKGVENTKSQMKELVYQITITRQSWCGDFQMRLQWAAQLLLLLKIIKCSTTLFIRLIKQGLLPKRCLLPAILMRNMCIFRMFFHITIISAGTAAMCQCTAIGLIHSTRNIQTRQSV